MKRYLELTRIARALKAETWRSGAGNRTRGTGRPGNGKVSLARPQRRTAGLALATTTAGPP